MSKKEPPKKYPVRRLGGLAGSASTLCDVRVLVLRTSIAEGTCVVVVMDDTSDGQWKAGDVITVDSYMLTMGGDVR